LDGACNKTIGILAFEVYNHLPLPGEIIITGKLSCYPVMKVIEEGSRGEVEVVAWGWCIGCIGGVGRGSFGGHGLTGSKKKRLESLERL
jgi:hypothetical protein